ncbi:MAG: phage tail length tape measure family protein [Candidatus Obscuribacterales bacterium]|nr:phage tail length tape measure family protein [Candidatus Obscuribacterales bacterium]
MAKVGAVTMEMQADIGSFTRNINKAVNETNSAVKKIQGSFTGLQNLMIGFGASFSIGQIVQEAAESELAMKQLEATIRSTGGTAGISAQELGDLSSQLQQTSTYSDEAIQNMESLLLTFTNIGGEVIPRASQAILDMSTKLGIDLNSAAMKAGKALNDPINGIASLSKMGITFTESQKKVMEQMVHAGHAADAQAMILEKLEGKYAGAAAAARDTLDGALKSLSLSFTDLLEQIGLDSKGGLRYGTELLITSFQYLAAHSKEVEKGLLAIAVASASVVAVQLPANISTLALGMGNLARALNPVTLGFGLLIGSIILFDDQITKARKDLYSFLHIPLSKSEAMGFVETITNLTSKGFSTLAKTMPDVSKIIEDTNKRIADLTRLSGKAGNALAVDFGDAVEKSKKKVKSLKEQMDELFQKDYQEGINNMIANQKALDEQLKGAVQGMLSPWDTYTQNVGKLMELARQFPQNAAEMSFAIRKLSQEFAQSTPEVQRFNETAQKLKQEFAASMDATIHKGEELRKQASDTIDMLDLKMADMEKGFFSLGDASKQLGNNIVTAFDQAIFSGKSLTDVVKNLGMAILRIAEQQFILTPLQNFIAGIPSMLGGLFKPSSSQLGGGIPLQGPIHLPMLASGGSLSAGQLSIVGEKGPELFLPKSDGTVIPNGAFGGTSRPNVTVNIINQTDSRIVQQRTVNPDGSEDFNVLVMKAVTNGVQNGDAELMAAFRNARATGRM